MNDDYDIDYYKNNGQIGDRIALKYFAALVKKKLKQGKIMDFGCGTGFFLKKFSSDQYQKFGFDISDDALQIAKQNNPNSTFIQLDKIEDESLDCICSLHTLEHIDDPKPIVETFQKKLKKGGLLFVIMPNDSSIGKKLKKEDWFAYHDKTHVSLLKVEEWKQILSDSGFSITRIGADGLWDTPYLKYIPHFLQKLFFYPTAFIQIVTKTLFIPLSWGEDVIIFARKN